MPAADPLDVVSRLGMDDHLDECAHTHEPARRCGWCSWALAIPEIDALLGFRADATALLGAAGSEGVPWVIAATELIRVVDRVSVRDVRVPSARRIADHLRRAIADDLGALHRRLSEAVAPGGPVERQCLRVAGPVAAAAVQLPEHRDVAERLPVAVRRRLEALSASLSATLQLAAVVPMVDDLHAAAMPPLTTQPEWRRRGPADRSRSPRARAVAETALGAGSLEAFVVESLLDSVTEELTEMGDELLDAAPPVRMARPADQQAYASRTRETLWRVARIDWHLSFVDSGRAACWNTRVVGERRVTEVPWTVAMAIAATEPLGLVSATHAARPLVLGTPAVLDLSRPCSQAVKAADF